MHQSKTDQYLSAAALRKARKQALAKFAVAPVPTEADRVRMAGIKAKQAGSRHGGDARGNTTDRKRRAAKLLTEFGNGHTAGCIYCGIVVDHDSIEQDRMYPGAMGGGYRYANLVPACRPCNASRADAPMQLALAR